MIGSRLTGSGPRRRPVPGAAPILVMVILATGLWADSRIEPLAGTNLLLGQRATYSLEPNYSLSAGGDATDLSDGRFWQPGESGFWTDKGTVGWLFDVKPGVLISFDLGEVRSIDAIGFDTASGASQVTFPAALFAYVSDDGESWHYVGDLIDAAIPQDRYTRHRFVARDLNTRGRHLAVFVAKGGFYAFVDEIEAIEGEGDPAAVSFAGAEIARAALEEDASRRAADAAARNIGRYFVQAARDQVFASEAGERTAVLRQLDALEQEAIAAEGSEAANYSRGLPYDGIGRRICAAMGTYFRTVDDRSAIIWQPDDSIWSHRTSPFARPTVETSPTLHADMMIGEYEPVAFNVSNNTDEAIGIRVKVGGPLSTSGGPAWPTDQIESRISTHVVGMGFLFFDDALQPLNEETVVPPGMTRQVWLILHARGLASGQYAGTVHVALGDASFELPLSATVYPVEMPADPLYTAQSWGYFTWEPARGYELAAAAELERAYANSHVLHHEYIPWPEVDPETRQLVRPIEVDFARLDEMLAYRPYVRQWLLWTGFEFGFMDLNYRRASDIPEIGTPEHEALFKEWVRQIRDHMRDRGFGTDQWAFYWVDEPGDESFLEHIVPSSRMAKEVDPSILIWEDHQISVELLERHPDAIDIHSCPLSYYRQHPETLDYVLGQKHAGVMYSMASAKTGDPHRYYRLHHMSAVELGLEGAGMWVWGDNGGQFNDYAGRHPSYGMVYATADGPITGKRREAWREGIEDVELWRHLGRAAAATGDSEMARLHREGPTRMVNRQSGRADLVQVDLHTGTPGELMAIRLQALEALATARAE